MNKIKYAEKARDSILDIVVKNFDYFRDNPKHLAWAMMKWSLVHTASRIAYGACEDNPKYSILDAGEDLKSEQDSDLLYDAWAVTVSNEVEFPDDAREPNWKKLAKPNKTLDEWLDIKSDPQYKYKSLYKDKREIINNLLCTIGTGYGWNKDGFITRLGPSGVDEDIFAGYTLAESEVRRDIRIAINKFLKSKTLKRPTDNYMKMVEINWGDNEVEKTILNKGWEVERAFRGQPELLSRAQEAYRFVAYLEELVKIASKWSDKQWAEARKKPIWKYKDYELDISQVQPNFMYSTYDFGFETRTKKDKNITEDDLRVGRSLTNPRDRAWRKFVFEVNDHPEAKRAQNILKKTLSKNKPSKKETDSAKKILRKYQPNYLKYIDVYNSAYKGNKNAIKILNKIVGIPKSGWDAVRFIVDTELKQQESLNKFLNRGDKKKKTYYPINEYSNMVRMPKNAHSSYVHAAIKVAQEIIDNESEPARSKKYAKRFLKQWKSEPNNA